MAFLTDVQELKPGLIIFRRTDVKHRNWYCRVRIPKEGAGTPEIIANPYKTISLGTPDNHEARSKAFDHDAEIRFKVKHQVPIFSKTFAEVAKEYVDSQKSLADSGQITINRYKTVEVYVRLHLAPYVGYLQITMVGEDRWKGYPAWRRQHTKSTSKHGKEFDSGTVTDTTIRHELKTFRSIMLLAAEKQYIRERQVPKSRIPLEEGRREEFTPQEYRALHTFARGWIKQTTQIVGVWTRTVAYNYMLIMTNTGMRTMEARNLRWRDIDERTDSHGRRFVVINVRGKGKFRELVASQNVADYLARIREISKATGHDDFVFTTFKGKHCDSLYVSVIRDFLVESKLLTSSSGSDRSAYCFRHTYATFRLMEGIDVYFLAKQMGTSVQMIEKHYGHITPSKNAGLILEGIPGWESIAEGDGEKTRSVNAEGDGTLRDSKNRAARTNKTVRGKKLPRPKKRRDSPQAP